MMRFEWTDYGRGHVARVGEWKLEAWRGSDGEYRATACLDDVELTDAQYTRFATLDEAKAAAERWVREYVAPFVAAAERERDELRALLDEINREDMRPGEAYGCGSHSCVVERPQGQGNNGGCRCSRGTLRRALRRERERTAAAVEAERAACAEIAGRIAEINATARGKMVDPSNAAVREVEARIETADGIACAIRARKDGAR